MTNEAIPFYVTPLFTLPMGTVIIMIMLIACGWFLEKNKSNFFTRNISYLVLLVMVAIVLIPALFGF